MVKQPNKHINWFVTDSNNFKILAPPRRVKTTDRALAKALILEKKATLARYHTRTRPENDNRLSLLEDIGLLLLSNTNVILIRINTL